MIPIRFENSRSMTGVRLDKRPTGTILKELTAVLKRIWGFRSHLNGSPPPAVQSGLSRDSGGANLPQGSNSKLAHPTPCPLHLHFAHAAPFHVPFVCDTARAPSSLLLGPHGSSWTRTVSPRAPEASALRMPKARNASKCQKSLLPQHIQQPRKRQSVQAMLCRRPAPEAS